MEVGKSQTLGRGYDLEMTSRGLDRAIHTEGRTVGQVRSNGIILTQSLVEPCNLDPIRNIQKDAAEGEWF